MNPNYQQSLLNLIPGEQKKLLSSLPTLVHLPEEEKQKAMDQLLEVLLMRVLERIVQDLTEDDIQQLEVLDKNNSQEALAYLKTRVPNLDSLIKQEAASLLDSLNK